jgi:hypothetical protein
VFFTVLVIRVIYLLLLLFRLLRLFFRRIQTKKFFLARFIHDVGDIEGLIEDEIIGVV